MSHYELVTFADADELAQAAACDWLNELRHRPSDGTPYLVAVSGGRIARLFFSRMAELATASRMAWDSVHFFWADERCVLPSDRESNYWLAQEYLLRPLGIPERQVHRLCGELVVELASVEAEQTLKRLAPETASGMPVLDLIFLGMGEDGHVASLFPGEPQEAMASRAVFRPVRGPKPPARRITMGYPVLAAARQVWVLASG